MKLTTKSSILENSLRDLICLMMVQEPFRFLIPPFFNCKVKFKNNPVIMQFPC